MRLGVLGIEQVGDLSTADCASLNKGLPVSLGGGGTGGGGGGESYTRGGGGNPLIPALIISRYMLDVKLLH